MRFFSQYFYNWVLLARKMLPTFKYLFVVYTYLIELSLLVFQLILLVFLGLRLQHLQILLFSTIFFKQLYLLFDAFLHWPG